MGNCISDCIESLFWKHPTVIDSSTRCLAFFFPIYAITVLGIAIRKSGSFWLLLGCDKVSLLSQNFSTDELNSLEDQCPGSLLFDPTSQCALLSTM